MRNFIPHIVLELGESTNNNNKGILKTIKYFKIIQAIFKLSFNLRTYVENESAFDKNAVLSFFVQRQTDSNIQ
jgi:hypothetical protein